MKLITRLTHSPAKISLSLAKRGEKKPERDYFVLGNTTQEIIKPVLENGKSHRIYIRKVQA